MLVLVVSSSSSSSSRSECLVVTSLFYRRFCSFLSVSCQSLEISINQFRWWWWRRLISRLSSCQCHNFLFETGGTDVDLVRRSWQKEERSDTATQIWPSALSYLFLPYFVCVCLVYFSIFHYCLSFLAGKIKLATAAPIDATVLTEGTNWQNDDLFSSSKEETVKWNSRVSQPV